MRREIVYSQIYNFREDKKSDFKENDNKKNNINIKIAQRYSKDIASLFIIN